MGGPLHDAGAFGKRRVFPVLKRRVGLSNGITHCSWSHLVVCLDGFTCGRVDSLECHTMSSFVVIITAYTRRSHSEVTDIVILQESFGIEAVADVCEGSSSVFAGFL